MTLTYLKLALTATFWGGTFIAGRMLADMGALPGAFLRFVVATLFLLTACVRAEGCLPRLGFRPFLGVLALGLTGVFLYNWFFLSGLQTVDAGHASLIIAAMPAVIAVLSALLFKESFGPRKALGVATCVCGALVVISRGDPLAIVDRVSAGDLWILGCIGSWTAYSLLGKKVMEHMTPLGAVTWSSLLGCLLLLPAALATGLASDLAQAGPAEWGAVVYLGVFGTGLGFTWYYQGIRSLGPARAGVFINLVPVNAVVMGWLILGESVGWSLLAGAGLVLTGVWLVNRPAPSSPLARLAEEGCPEDAGQGSEEDCDKDRGKGSGGAKI